MTPDEIRRAIDDAIFHNKPSSSLDWNIQGTVAGPLSADDVKRYIDIAKNAPLKEDGPIILPPTPEIKRLLKYRSN